MQSSELELNATDTLFAVSTGPVPVEPLSLLDLLMRGGWLMIPIGLLSILAVYIFVERLLVLRRAKTNPQRFMQQVGTYVRAGDIAGAIAFCQGHDTPISRILIQGLERLGRPITEIQDAIQAAGKNEAYNLESRTDGLASVAAIAPMVGFLGTVTGMIAAFQQVQALEGAASPAALASGIWEALVTTAFGLAVGIVALFAYNFLVNRIGRLLNDIQIAAADFIDLLQSPTNHRGR